MNMKIPICLVCKTPLKIKGKFAKFRCMCDGETRSLPIDDFQDNEFVIYIDSDIDENIVSEVFLKDWLTISKKLIH